MRNSFLFTSESVSEGHPDKVADQISDSIVDLFLSKDPEARVACETLTTTQLVVLAGEIRCKGVFEDGEWAPGALDEIEATVRNTVKDIGYEQAGFHWNQFRFENNLHGQSAHIAQGVDESADKDEGAGDQGIMFGYASDETPDLMPATLDYAHKILERMAADRKAGIAPFLEPDAKSQVTLRYANERPVEATAIVVSTQHAPGYFFHGGEGAGADVSNGFLRFRRFLGDLGIGLGDGIVQVSLDLGAGRGGDAGRFGPGIRERLVVGLLGLDGLDDETILERLDGDRHWSTSPSTMW